MRVPNICLYMNYTRKYLTKIIDLIDTTEVYDLLHDLNVHIYE